MMWASSIKKGRDGLSNRLIKELEELLASSRDDVTMEKLIDTRIRLNMEIDKDEMYWEQKARANCLQLGDKNSAFFHKYSITRKRINTIARLESDGGQEISDELVINEAASNYFQNLFTSKGVGNLSYLLTGINTNVSSDINTDLLVPFTAEEVFSALKGIGPTKALGCDGFSALFFQRFWHKFRKNPVRGNEQRRWNYPPSEFVKINFDGANDATHQQSALGIVARNEEGVVLLSCSEIHHGVTFAFAAEAIACQKAVQTGVEQEWPKIIIEVETLKRKEEMYLDMKVLGYAENQRKIEWRREPD
ncbi:hypothetical protein PVK06_045251 [Gossypium arboreum]|uniref:RNase H type-1 domain-containing protein n=1 Tax=Gossypium arboreum TaxID=29729 RepID=A0ABR0MTK2_GOSAR|nr:hypothetical protein PVK06_045251 [Gossypium arboreum]